MRRHRSAKLVGTIVALVIAYGGHKLGIIDWPSSAPPVSSGDAGSTASSGAEAIGEAHRARRSGVVVEFAATVEKPLDDDLEPPRHQRFIVRLSTGMTVLVAHNTDLAPRVPVEAGAAVRVLGQYEWNEQGGVVHWTHHDPQNRRRGGWIEYGGKRYE